MSFLKMRFISALIFFPFFASFCLLSNAQAAERKETQPEQSALNYFADGVEALDVEDFQDAIRSFKRAIELEPANLEFQYYLGVTYARLNRDQEALEIFGSIVKKDPANFLKAYFDIAAIYNKKKLYHKTLEALSLAEKIDPNSSRIALEKGYAYKNSRDYDQAIKSFNRAKELDPKLTQLAYYMIAATYLEEEKFKQAAELFTKAVEVAPGTPLAESARQTIPRVETAAWARKPWYLLTSFNWAYDDNVPLDPLSEIGIRPIGLPSGAGDQFQTFLLRAGYKFINQTDLEAGLGYTLFSIGYKEWTQNNVTSHSPHFYIQATYEPVFLRFQYDFSYLNAGGKKQAINPPIYLTFGNNASPKLRMHSFMPTISILEPHDLRTDINLGYQIKDYLDGVTKNSTRYAGDITQSYKIPNTQCFPRIGYRHVYEPSGDNNSTYRYHEVFVGVSSHIFWGVWGDVSFAYMKTDYPDFYNTPGGRQDQTYTTAVTLNRNFFERLLVSFTYLHLKNDSDYVLAGTEWYTFNKNVYQLIITYTF